MHAEMWGQTAFSGFLRDCSAFVRTLSVFHVFGQYGCYLSTVRAYRKMVADLPAMFFLPEIKALAAFYSLTFLNVLCKSPRTLLCRFQDPACSRLSVAKTSL